MPKLDVAALKRTIAKGQAAAAQGSLGPGGRPRTGTKAFVREHLDTILQLRDETGATWGQVVAALGAQHDLRGGDGQPITGRRLNALVSACLKERLRKQAAATARAGRPDLTRRDAQAQSRQPRGKDAPSEATAPTVVEAAAETPEAAPLSEDDIRRTQRERHRHLFK